MKLLAPAAFLLGLACGAAGCSSDPQADYCAAVEEHQADLSDVAASDDAGAVFDALDDYEELAEQAPRDIADDWSVVVGPLRTLEEALDAVRERALETAAALQAGEVKACPEKCSPNGCAYPTICRAGG